MSASKTIVQFGSLTTANGQTLLEPAQNSKTGSPTWSTAKSEFSQMDVLFVVNSITGTSVTVSVQELFSGTFVETAKSAAYTSSGSYILAHDGQTSQTGSTNIAYGFAMLGKGIDKRFVSTGTFSALSADIYLIFYH